MGRAEGLNGILQCQLLSPLPPGGRSLPPFSRRAAMYLYHVVLQGLGFAPRFALE